jgi:hypothetical protein
MSAPERRLSMIEAINDALTVMMVRWCRFSGQGDKLSQT